MVPDEPKVRSNPSLEEREIKNVTKGIHDHGCGDETI